MSKKLGLALGGGGARGVVHIGFLKALEEAGIEPYCIAGTSMGAVVGAAYGGGLSPDAMRGIVLKLKASDLVDIDIMPYTRLSLLRSKKLHKLLFKYMGEKSFGELKLPFCCTAVDLYTGKLHVFKEGDVTTAVQASSAVPGIFRAIQFEDKMLVDGGVLCRVPVRQAKELGADVVVGVDAIKNTGDEVNKIPNIISMLVRVFDVADNHIVRLERAAPDYPCDLMLEPELIGVTQYDLKNLDRVFDEGYETGRANIDRIKELLAD